MTYIKITSKRQATLPKALCQELNIQPGDSLYLDRREIDGQVVWCLQPVHTNTPPWFGALLSYAEGKSHDLQRIDESVEKSFGSPT